MLRGWAIHRSREIGADYFNASASWLHNFCKNNRIVSRKATEKVSAAQIRSQQNILARRLAFRESYISRSAFYPDSMIWDFDQSPFNYKLKTDRTLSSQSERETIVEIGQMNRITHSYTIQPIKTRDGRLLGKLLICLQGTNGRFGPIVRREVEEIESHFGNIYVMASTSGKMSILLMREWVDEVVVPALNYRQESLAPAAHNTTGDVSNVTSVTSHQATANASGESNEPLRGTSGLNLNHRDEDYDLTHMEPARVLLLDDS